MSANRYGPSGVNATGGVTPCGSIRWSRPSRPDEAMTLPPAARYEPPPYSWTLFRTLNGTGVSSWVAPSGPRRSSVRRPPSADRPSSQ